MTTRPMLAADHIRELTRPHSTYEIVTQPTRGDDGRWRPTRRVHHVTHAPLLDQIRNTITTTQTAGGTFHAAYSSKPAGRIDCLAYLERLERQSRRLAADLNLPAAPLTRRLQAISGRIGDQPHPLIRAWWATARILTQHDGPPYSPNVPCPNDACERIGTLRLRLSEKIGVCVECHTVWADSNTDETMTFGRLSVWVQWAAEHLSGIRHWVPATVENSGYDGSLGYQIECGECWTERLAMRGREAARLAETRRHRHAS